MARADRWPGRGALPAAGVLLLLFGGALAQALGTSLEGGGQAWRNIFGSDELWPSLGVTLRVALLSAAAATVLGLGLGLALRKVAATRGGRVARVVLQVPLPVPHLVVALSMLMLLAQSGLINRLLARLGSGATLPALVNDRGGVGIVLTYLWKEAPFVAVLVLSALRAQTQRLEEVARNLGAGPWRRFADVTLPAATPALRFGFVLVFAYTFGAFEVPRLLGQTRPSMLGVWSLRLYTDVDLSRRPEAMVVALLIFAVVAATAALVLRLGGTRGEAP